MCAKKRGAEFEKLSKVFLEKILDEIGYTVVRSGLQNSGTQDGYDVLIEIVDGNYRRRCIYVECKDYSTKLTQADAMEKIPHIVSTHEKVDLLLFMSPYKDFANTNEENKVDGFFRAISSECPVEFLTPRSFIREYFSLYPELYLSLYKEAPTVIDHKERIDLLERFDKFLFSDRNLKKIVVEESHRSLFIGDVQKDAHHIPRTLRKDDIADASEWEYSDERFPLQKILGSSKWGVVLLGNPGFGKTRELIDFAVVTWENREELQQLPVHRRLRNFNSATLIEDLLPSDYHHLGSLVIILDGIDEIHDITDFTNKLREFCSEKRGLLDAGSIRFVISCRTNIYLKYIKNIEGLTPAYLNGVPEGGAVRFLHYKFAIELIGNKAFDFFRFRDLTQNPFYLEMIGQSLKKDPKMVISRARLLESYIDRRLQEDNVDKYRNDPIFSPSDQLRIASELAIAMEVMQRTELKDAGVRKLIGDGRDCTKNPFLEQNPSGSWSFEHKNIQEYLTAKSISKLAFENMLELICVAGDRPKVHPSWHNVITFMLNMEFDDNVHGQFVDWIIANDIELLFLADPGTIPVDVRNRVLQQVFQKNCLEDSQWLSQLPSMAQFANTRENVCYLLEKLEDPAVHLRARISASSLLRDMPIVTSYSDRLEKLSELIAAEFRADPEGLLFLMQNVLNLVLDTEGPHRQNVLTNMIKELRDLDFKEVVGPLLGAMDGNNLSVHIDYILEILGKATGEMTWNYRSKYGSIISTKEKIFDIFRKTDDPEILMQVLDFVIERHNNYELREKEITTFYEHITPIFSANIADIGPRLGCIISDAVLNDKIRHYEDELLTALVKKTGMETDIVMQTLQHLPKGSTGVHFLAGLLNNKVTDQVIDAYNDGQLRVDILDSLRNISCYDDLETGLAFQAAVLERTGYRFGHIVDRAEREEDIRCQQMRQPREFDIKFDREALLLDMCRIFDHVDKQSLSKEDMDNFTLAYYHNNQLMREISTYAKDLLGEMVREKYKQTGLGRDQLPEALDAHALDRIEDIYNGVSENNRRNIEVSGGQRDFIEQWCLENQVAAKEFYKKPNYKTGNRNYTSARLIYGFQARFKFDSLDHDLLLSMIWQGMDHERLKLDYMEGIVPKEKIEHHISSLASWDKLDLSYFLILYRTATERGIAFPIDLPSLKNDIIEELDGGRSHSPRELIKQTELRSDVGFLKELLVKFGLEKRHAYFTPFLLETLVENRKLDHVEKFIATNRTEIIDQKIIEEETMVSLLMKNNSLLAFELITQKMREPLREGKELVSGYSGSWKSFSNKAAVPILFDIISLYIAGGTNRNVFHHTTSAVRMATETLISIASANGETVSLDVQREFLARNFAGKDDDTVFYLNGFRNDITDVITASRSIPYSLRDAVALLERYQYDLI